MKKFFTTALVVMTTMMTATMLTGCEALYDMEDRHEARTLDGTWSGYIETYYYDRWGLTGDSFRTTMYFERDNAYGGWGYEVDYDTYSRYSDYYYCEFEWEVYKGSIRIRYADSWNDVYINDYRLSNNYFEGYMDDGTTADISFRLSYDGNFDWGYWNTRGVTRGTEKGTGKSVQASGKFAHSTPPKTLVL